MWNWPPPARGYPGSISSRFFLRTLPSVQIRTDFLNSLVTAPSQICFPLYLQAASEFWRQRRARVETRSILGFEGSIVAVNSSCYFSGSPTVTKPEWGEAKTLYQHNILSLSYIINQLRIVVCTFTYNILRSHYNLTYPRYDFRDHALWLRLLQWHHDFTDCTSFCFMKRLCPAMFLMCIFCFDKHKYSTSIRSYNN